MKVTTFAPLPPMLFIGGRGWGKEVIKNASSLKPSPPAKNAGGEGAGSYQLSRMIV
jgi:hypothetical protein